MIGLNKPLLISQLTKMQQDKNYLTSTPPCTNKYYKQVNRSTIQQMRRIFSFQETLLEKEDKKANDKTDINNQRFWNYAQHKLLCLLKLWLQYQQKLAEEIEKLLKSENNLFSDIFVSKDRDFLFYSVRLITFVSDFNRQQWNPNELIVLNNIISQQRDSGTIGNNRYRWKKVAQELFRRSNQKYFRTPHQCSEKYVNHINPLINKNAWAAEEDISLIGLIEKHGLKWSMITRLMKTNRTQHMVKNRYHTIVNDFKKKASEYISQAKLMKYLKQYRVKLQKRSKEVEVSQTSLINACKQSSQQVSLKSVQQTKKNIEALLIEDQYKSESSLQFSTKKTEMSSQLKKTSQDCPVLKSEWLELLWYNSKMTLFNDEWLEPREEIANLSWIEDDYVI